MDDAALTENGLGLEATQPRGRVLLLACGALACEILALIEMNGWSHMDLKCLPAKLHLHPDRIPDAVEEAVVKHRDAYETIFVVYADCGTGGLLQTRCEALGIEMVAGPHCYSFFDGNDAFLERSETEFTSFFLTDFLVKQFDAFVWKPMGLDRHPQLRDMIFGNYEKLVYLAQINDPTLVVKAKECADRLGLIFEHRQTGYGDLQPALAAIR